VLAQGSVLALATLGGGADKLRDWPGKGSRLHRAGPRRLSGSCRLTVGKGADGARKVACGRAGGMGFAFARKTKAHGGHAGLWGGIVAQALLGFRVRGKWAAAREAIAPAGAGPASLSPWWAWGGDQPSDPSPPTGFPDFITMEGGLGGCLRR
jgi:hypothetical protein